jgi:hypothetical protein
MKAQRRKAFSEIICVKQHFQRILRHSTAGRILPPVPQPATNARTRSLRVVPSTTNHFFVPIANDDSSRNLILRIIFYPFDSNGSIEEGGCAGRNHRRRPGRVRSRDQRMVLPLDGTLRKTASWPNEFSCEYDIVYSIATITYLEAWLVPILWLLDGSANHAHP